MEDTQDIYAQISEQYNPEGSNLRKLQLRMLDILTAFDEICQRHRIPYFLGYGTLLGARRHGGFIPWDDDVDISIFLKDSRRLMKILEKELPDAFKVQSRDTDKNYWYFFPKVRDTKSRLNDKDDSKQYKFKGAYIDVFPVKPVFSIVLKGKLDRWIFKYALRNEQKGFRRFLCSSLVLLAPLYYLWTVLPDVLNRFVKTAEYSEAPGVFFYRTYNIKEILPLKKIKFEGREFNCPNDVDAYLKRHYGDFMKIPPVEKRVIHVSQVEFL